MTITFIEEISEGRTATNQKGMRSYTRKFKLKSSVESEGPYAVGSDANLPKIGALYPDDPFAWCTTLSVEQFSGRWGWIVTANYSSERELAEDPTADPALTEWDGEQYQRPLVIDEDGNVVCNSAGDPFDPPEMIDDSRLISTTVKNLAVVPTWIMQYANAVNTDAFVLDGFPVGIGQAKMQRPRVSRPQRRNGIAFREVTFTINYREEGWLVNLLDAGFRERAAASGSGAGGLINIVNAGDGLQPSAPVPLDGSGNSLADPSPTNNVNLTFRGYRRLPFSILPLT